MKLFVLASRNLWRNRIRTLVTVSAITFGLMMIVFTITLQTGSYDTMIRTAVGASVGNSASLLHNTEAQGEPMT